MGVTEHGHGRHGHHHLPRGSGSRDADRRALSGALALLLGIMTVEVVAGILSGSLALLADAGHMLTDALALGFALVAISMAARPAGGVWTYGLGRAEVLAAQVNGISLLLVGLWISYEAVRRLIEPPDVRDAYTQLRVAADKIRLADDPRERWPDRLHAARNIDSVSITLGRHRVFASEQSRTDSAAGTGCSGL